ncbi:MAG TPA: PIG-L family deacetylase [Thermoanaerobaculia bacterium]|nr:PIG-L family deacetylase [Thermoanaerobaculia bacterium]
MRSRSLFPLPLLFALLLAAASVAPGWGQAPPPAATAAPVTPGPRVLLVTAHPDDDALFGGAVYKLTHQLGGWVDEFMVTNGEGGFHYSTLAEPLYGKKLTDEKVGREYLPGIRKREVLAGGAIIGIRTFFFMDQQDNQYTRDVDSVLKGNLWDLDMVRARLRKILAENHYDFVFVMLPGTATHAHHASAAILALEVIQALPAEGRPVVLAAFGYKKSNPTRVTFTVREGYPITKIKEGVEPFEFDRTQKFGYQDRLDYNIPVNWLIAEHKSQGTMQLLMNGLDVEQYWYFDLNGDRGLPAARALFERLKTAANP